MHQRQWVCNEDCHQKFATKDLMVDHLRKIHLSSLVQHQLPIMADMSERPIDEDEILACPLCPDTLYLSRLQNHLAEHLETISLFVLPNEIEENENTESDKVAGIGSKPDQDESGTQFTISSLGFSQTNETFQTKEDFFKLLSMEEAKAEVKFEVWRADEAISAAIQELKMVDTYKENLVTGLDQAPTQQEDPLAHGLPAHMFSRLEDPDTLANMANMASLALTYQDQGQWAAAEELQVSVVEISKKNLGADHPSTLTHMANLALTYSKQGRWKEAEDLQVLILETRKRVLGHDHPDTLMSMVYLAMTYFNQSRWKEAEDLQVLVVEISKEKLGADHPSTLTGMANLAMTYFHQSRWKEAEELQVLVVEISKKNLGADYPNTLTVMANLAWTYSKQGRWKEAEDLQVLVVEKRKIVLGHDHPDTLASMANLAWIYSSLGRWKEAEDLLVLVIEKRKIVLGHDHPDTLTSMHKLALTLKSINRDAEALNLMQNCMTMRTRVLGAHAGPTMLSDSFIRKWEGENLASDTDTS